MTGTESASSTGVSPLVVDPGPLGVHYGHLNGPVGPIRAADFALRSPMGGFVSDLERDAAFRSFQFMGVVGPDMAAGAAVTSTRSESSPGLTAFAYLWSGGRFTQLRLGSRPGDPAVFGADPDHGVTELVTGRGSVVMEAGPWGLKRLSVESQDLVIELSFGSAADPLRLCTPTGPTGWTYVQKVAAVDAVGRAHTGGRGVEFAEVDALAHHDYTTGFLRPETWWHWACVATRLPDGRRFGLNLSCGTNESGFRENCGWVDDTRFDLGGALFDFDPDNTEAPWRVWGSDGRVELRFTPGHGYHAQADTEGLTTNFHQLFGRFDGWVLAQNGERIDLVAAPGFTENQFLVW